MKNWGSQIFFVGTLQFFMWVFFMCFFSPPSMLCLLWFQTTMRMVYISFPEFETLCLELDLHSDPHRRSSQKDK